MSAPKDTALGYAKHGIRVFPCQPNKKIPFAGGHGCLDATTDTEVIEAWWTDCPDANVAIATGGGLVVIDIDTKGDTNGWESLETLMRAHGDLPTTRWAQTPSGGAHFYFRTPGEVRNSAGKLGAGVDVRGDGGYVLAPPSVTDGKHYIWLGRGTSAPLPDAWVELLQDKPDAPVPVTVPVSLPRGKSARQAYLLAALEGERGELRSAPEGTRNHALNKYGFCLGQLVHLGLRADDIVASAEWAMSQWTWSHGRFRSVQKELRPCIRQLR